MLKSATPGLATPVALHPDLADTVRKRGRLNTAVAGYSKTPLVRKLGIKPGQVVALVNAPDDYGDTLGAFPDGVILRRRLVRPIDFCQVFCPALKDLHKRVPAAVRALARDGTLWLCWPKKASGLQTDVGEADIRRFGLDSGLVDVKICAIDDTWSGLKFVYRLKDRK